MTTKLIVKTDSSLLTLFLRISLRVLIAGVLGSCFSTCNAAEAYRRLIPIKDLIVEGARFSPATRGNFIEAKFTSLQDLAAAKPLRASLEKDMPKGAYSVWVQVAYFDPYISDPKAGEDEKMTPAERKKKKQANKEYPISIKVSLGNSSAVMTIPRSGSRKLNSTAGHVTVDAKTTFTTIELKLLSLEPQIKLGILYVTDRLGDIRFNRDIGVPGFNRNLICDEAAGKPRTSDIPEPDNWIQNGSFEVGPPVTEWSEMYQSRRAITPRNRDNTQTVDGNHSLRLKQWLHRYVPAAPPTGQLMHKVIKLKPNKTYYFRGMFKASHATRLTVLYDGAYGKHNLHYGSKTVSLKTEWQAVEMEIKTDDDDRGGYIYLNTRALTGSDLWHEPHNVWMDSLVLAEKKPDRFVPSAPVEIGLDWTAPGKIFYLDEPKMFSLLVKNYSHHKKPAAVTIKYRVIDYFGLTVLTKTINGMSVYAGRTLSRDLNLSRGKTGAFLLHIDGTAEVGGEKISIPLQEYAFSILNRPPEKMKGTLGAYINVNPEPLEIMSRAGIRRTVTLSCKNELLSTWAFIEPEKGKFVWWDDHVAMAKKYKVDIINNLELQTVPKWAKEVKPGEEVLKWGGRVGPTTISKRALVHFLEAMVEHYKDDIHEWLIVDEPYHYFSAEQYADLLKTAYITIKRVDPKAFVWAHGGYYKKFRKDLEKAGAMDYMDGMSDYARGPAHGDHLKLFRENYRKPVMSVEYSWMVSMFQTFELPESCMNGEARSTITHQDNGLYLASIPVKYMAWSGAGRFNRYDARYPGGDFRHFENSKCMFEYDGSLKPSAVAYAVTAQLLDGFHGVRELDIQPQLETFLLADKERVAIVFRVRDKQALATTLDLPTGVDGFDIMGNPLRVKPEKLLVSGNINYLIGPRAKYKHMLRALTRARFEDVVRIVSSTDADAKTGQYMYALKMTNLLPDESVGVEVYMSNLRRFWRRPQSIGPIAPGKTIETKFGLNAYEGKNKIPEIQWRLVMLTAYGTKALTREPRGKPSVFYDPRPKPISYRKPSDKISKRAAAVQPEALRQGLQALWKCDEGDGWTVQDAIGGNVGELQTEVGWADGKSGWAMQFNGNGAPAPARSSSYVVIPDSPSLSITRDMTLAAWVRVDKFGAYHNILAKSTNHAYRWRIEKSGKQLMLLINDGKASETLTIKTNLRPKTWYHLAVTLDFKAGKVRFFVNGDPQGNPFRINSKRLNDTDGPAGMLVIGAVNNTGAESFSGRLDEIRMYDRALQPSEIQALFYLKAE